MVVAAAAAVAEFVICGDCCCRCCCRLLLLPAASAAAATVATATAADATVAAAAGVYMKIVKLQQEATAEMHPHTPANPRKTRPLWTSVFEGLWYRNHDLQKRKSG